jgi:hypothetical protein
MIRPLVPPLVGIAYERVNLRPDMTILTADSISSVHAIGKPEVSFIVIEIVCAGQLFR